jgi:uncharacterized protein involved in exopolysaccharide biosynthesis
VRAAGRHRPYGHHVAIYSPSTSNGSGLSHQVVLAPDQVTSDYVARIRCRWRMVVVVAIATVLVAAAYIMATPHQYDAAASVLLADSEPIDVMQGTVDHALDRERDLNTSVSLVTVEDVSRAVRRRLGLQTSLSALAGKVRARPEGSSNVIVITVRDTNPKLAAAIANGYAAEYISFRRRQAERHYDAAADLARARLAAMGPGQSASKTAKTLLSRLTQFSVAAGLQTGGVESVQAAAVPTSAATPKPRRTVLLAVFVGLFAGCAVAIGLGRVRWPSAEAGHAHD